MPAARDLPRGPAAAPKRRRLPQTIALTINVDSLRLKLHQVQNTVAKLATRGLRAIVIVITETKLEPAVEITLPGFYCQSRRDRDRNGGGVAVFGSLPQGQVRGRCCRGPKFGPSAVGYHGSPTARPTRSHAKQVPKRTGACPAADFPIGSFGRSGR